MEGSTVRRGEAGFELTGDRRGRRKDGARNPISFFFFQLAGGDDDDDDFDEGHRHCPQPPRLSR